MTADVFGIILIVVSIVLYFLTRKSNPKLSQFFGWCSGVGVGVLIGAVWVVSAVQRMLP